MATKQTRSGLLFKVAKFVRYPNVHWSDLDKIERDSAVVADPMLVHNRQTLKDMIERKRHDDAIRQLEFDQLRQLRRQAPVSKPDTGEKSSFLVSVSGSSELDDRALTIRKIDEIEAQMSMQWWKAKEQPPRTDSPSSLQTEARGSLETGSRSFFASTQLKGSLLDFDDVPTLFGREPNEQALAGGQDGVPASRSEGPYQSIDNKGFDSSKLFAAEMADNLADPDLEEAAVRFANGDDAGAESVLLSALRAQPALSDVAQAQAEALFDLYRSLGQRASFEREALNYAQQFGCPAPLWLPTPVAQSRLQAASTPAFVWHCPAQLELQDLAPLPSHLPDGHCVSLDWSSLEVITALAAQNLATLLAGWSAQEGALYFEGEQALYQVLCAATPRGGRHTEPFWWDLRFDVLRILGWQDDFEIAAFDFCLTYEIAPRSWWPASCELLQQAPAALTHAPEVPADWPRPVETPQSPTMPSSGDPSSSLARLELVGELLGDAALGLAPLNDASQRAQALTISCTDLIRVDFFAAGSILNWVAQGQAQGSQIEFRDVPPLVASFFNLIGINQHAQVITRTH